MDAIRRKRSNDGASMSARRSELEEQLAELRDQEAELVRAIELVIADEKAQKLTTDAPFALLSEKPTAEPKDYDQKVKQVTEAKKRRAKAFWGDVRKVVNALKNVKALNSVFGVPVRETTWGSVPAHYELYTSVIAQPMDLRTIRGKLGDDEHSQQYAAPHEVVHDIQLIVENCNKFNTGAQNEQVRKLAESLGQQFEKRWREGGFEQRWQRELAQQQKEVEELQALQTAANGGVVEKVRYFEKCTESRLQEIPTGEPTEFKPFTWEQKRKLSLACSRISDADSAAVLDIISQCTQLPAEKDGEIVVTLDDLPPSILYRIQKRVQGATKIKVEEASQPAELPRQPVEVAAPSTTAQPAAPTTAAAAANPPVELSAPAEAAAPETARTLPVTGTDPGDKDGGGNPAVREEAETARPQADTSGKALANGSAPTTEAGTGAESREDTGNSSSSESNKSSSSSSDDDDDANSKGSSNASEQGKGNHSGDSQQGESGAAAAAKEASPREKHPSADGAETVLMSRNVPLGEEKPAPSILEAKDDGAKEIQIENEDDWAVPAEDDQDEAEPMQEDAKPAGDEGDGQVGSQPGSRPGSQPGSQPDSQPVSQPDSQPGSRPGSQADSQRGSRSGSQPESRPGSPPGSQTASRQATPEANAESVEPVKPPEGMAPAAVPNGVSHAPVVSADPVMGPPGDTAAVVGPGENADTGVEAPTADKDNDAAGGTENESPSNKRKLDEVLPSMDKDQAEGEAQKKIATNALVSAAPPEAVPVGAPAGEN